MEYEFTFKHYLGNVYDDDIWASCDVVVVIHGNAPDNLEIKVVRIFHDNIQPLEMSETQFTSLFVGGFDIINNALEDAAKNGVYSEPICFRPRSG